MHPHTHRLSQALLLCVVLLFAGVSHPVENGRQTLAGEAFRTHSLIPLHQNLKFREGDDPAWAAPDLDDSAWTIKPDTRLASGTWAGIGWFRLHLDVHPTLWHTPLGLLYHHQGAAEIYLDGRLLYTFGTVGQSAETEAIAHVTDLVPRKISLDSAHHVLAIRYSNFRAEAFRQLGIVPGFSLFLAKWDAQIENLSGKHLRYQIFFTSVPLAFGGLHLLLFLFHARSRENLYYALHTGSIAATTYLVFNLQIADAETLFLLARASRIAILSVSISGLLFIYTLFYPRLPRQFWGFLAAGALVAAWSWNVPVHIVYGFTLLGMAELFRVIVLALYRKQDGAWIIGLGTLAFTLATGYQILLLFGIAGDIGPFGYVYVYGVLGMLISMSVYLARNVGKTKQELETQLRHVWELTARLEQKVAERTHELSDKNARLEEALSQLKEAQLQLVQTEKMAALGSLIAGIVHEMNSPVGAINSAQHTLTRAIDKLKHTLKAAFPEENTGDRTIPPIVRIIFDAGRALTAATARITELTRSLRNFSRLDEAEFQVVDLQEGIESALTLLRPQIGDNITLTRDYTPLAPIYCAPARLNQVFLDILKNATQAIQGPGEIRIETFGDGGTVCVRITDTGVGIPPEQLNHLFDIGFRTRDARVKMGLGLSTAYSIIREHEGDLQVRSEVGKGTEVTIRLPVRRRPEPA